MVNTNEKIQRIIKAAYKFESRELAFSFANRCIKSMAVMLGDDENFWVVTLADAAVLEKAGYEWVK
ncbi:hypothetical protein [Thermoanaerobacterium sp. RBIITD]|uniref:hypothetical protein n=1 Tax=Thermoanaerobacterium sp. RBIITD TaxID=1550240 RepID=UPI000BBFFBA6|nr:hypothetical protein [Thermoanaerobacterium sp. RBIITD]SNX54868.1 hypothetical protein SAMN05660242_2604 [Thermoanaerobacterium sp. RBIITD]